MTIYPRQENSEEKIYFECSIRKVKRRPLDFTSFFLLRVQTYCATCIMNSLLKQQVAVYNTQG